MKDKEKLKKLVALIGDLLKVEGNEWLVEDLLKEIGETYSVDEISKHSVIQNIHEYCVEQKIESQANEFYKSFPIESIKDQLILDYRKMEHERRRDDFESFCLSMYQQLENIINHLADNEIIPKWKANNHKVAFEYPNKKTITEKELIWGKATQWYSNVKFKAVLFYYYFNKEPKSLIPFYERDEVFSEIYQIRNKNHRGTKSTEFQQSILNRIKGNESRYYFKFYGFLQDFISKIELNRPNTSKSHKMDKPKKQEPYKPTLGTLDSDLQKLKDKLDGK